MTAARCIVVDDEPLARLRLETLLAEDPAFEVVASIGDPHAALARIVAEPPEVVFLDVRMPSLDGIRLLAALRESVAPERRPYVVLVTAFDRYALEAFELEALDYLVKPFADARFRSTLERARERLRQRERSAAAPADAGPLVALGEGARSVRIAPAAITWVESSGHYLLVHTRARSHLVRGSIAEAEEQLGPHGFLRVHRGALVQPARVESVEREGSDRELRLMDGSRVAVSRRRWAAVRDALA